MKYNRSVLQSKVERDIKELRQEEPERSEHAGLNQMFRINPKLEEVVEVPLEEIRDFGGSYGTNRFQIRQEKVEEVAKSIQVSGILTPCIVRNDKSGLAKYECIAGHTRRKAAELAGKRTIPVIIRDCSDEEAVEMMAATNQQREDLLPSEKGWIYRIEYESMKRKAGRRNGSPVGNQTEEERNGGPVGHQKSSKGNGTPVGPQAEGERNGSPVGNQEQEERNSGPVGHQKKTLQILADKNEESMKQIQRYIRLTYLSDFLLEKVDHKKLSVRAGVELSYLTEKEQFHVNSCMIADQKKVSIKQAEQLKQRSQQAKKESRELTIDEIAKILTMEEPKKESGGWNLSLPPLFRQYLPREYEGQNWKQLAYIEQALLACKCDPELQRKIQAAMNAEGETSNG